MDFPVPSAVSNSPNALHLNIVPGSSDPTEDEWPMFRGQLNHTGEAHTALINPTIPFSNYQTGGSVYSSPAVAEGRLYVGSYDKKVYCLNATTGGLLWNYTTGGYIWSSPAVVGGRVYMGSWDSKVYCLNASTGGHLWNYSTDDTVRSSPAIADGRVYLGDYSGRIYCLNATTGMHLWNYNTTLGDMVASSPAIAGGIVYVTAYSKLYFLNATSGEFLWSYNTGNPIYSSPAVVTDLGVQLLLIGAGYQILCLNTLTRTLSWTYNAGDRIMSSPAVVGERLYVGSIDGVIHCVDLSGAGGGRIWTYNTGDAVYSSPAVVGGRLYVGSYDKNVYCLNASTGKLFYRFPTGGLVYSSPVVADGRVYVGCNDGKIYGPAPPAYVSVVETANPLELGAMETITISGVTSLSGIQTVLLEFEGANHTMTNMGNDTWCYATWTPSSTGAHPYKIYMPDNLGFCNTTAGAIQVIDTTPPDYIDVIKSADPLELGGTEMIAIAGVADLSGIQTVRLAFEGVNHTMDNLGGGTWRYNTWTPSSIGNFPYTIYIQDSMGLWNATAGSIQVVDTTPPTYLFVLESADPLGLGGTETITIINVTDLSGIQTVRLAFEGSNHTMSNLGGGTWRYNAWTPSSTGGYPYTIYIRDNAGNWKATSGAIQVEVTTPLNYLSVIESADPLELGGTEFIAVAGVTAPSGIQQVLLKFGGINHSMTDLGDGNWLYSTWIPSSLGNHPYTIYIQDNTGLWNWTAGTITVIDTTPPTYSTVIERYDPIQFRWYYPEFIGIQGVTDLSGIQTALLEFEGSNHTMSNWYNEWNYDDLYLNNTGIFSYTIYIADNANNWLAVSGLIHVLNLTTSCNSDPTQDEWPMFRGQLNHTGEAHTSLINSAIPFSNYLTGGAVYSSPAVVDGRIYVGSYDKKVYCLNATTGGLLWNYTVGSGVYSSPSVVGGRLYVGCDNNKIYCLNATTGGHLWNYSTDDMVRSSPAIADGRVYVTDFGGSVYCLNATTGEQLWKFTTEWEVSVWSPPAVAGGCVYVGSSDRKLYCFNATTGEILWSYLTSGEIRSCPAVSYRSNQRFVYFAAGYQIICLNAISGEMYWTYNAGDLIFSSPAIVGNRLYVGSLDGVVHCVNLASSGGRIWTYKTGGAVYSSPAVAGGRLYVGSNDKNVYCLDATTGGLLFKYPVGGTVWSSPAVAGGRVYVGCTDGKVYGPALPSYAAVIETANPLELGTMETITISGVTSLSGIQTVLLEFEGSNQTMSDMGDGTWCYTNWTPNSTGDYPYKIYIQDSLGFWNTTAGMIQVVDNTSPAYLSVIESADPLELGGTEIISLAGVSDLSGIQTVRLAFGGSNHTMDNLGGGTWRYNTWTPSSIGNFPYAIYIQDSTGLWNTTVGAIQVVDTMVPAFLSVVETADPLGLGGTETITIMNVTDLSGIQTVRLAFGGSNHTMSNLGGGTWRYNAWTPSSIGTYPYTIYIQDNAGNWKATSGVIQVVVATPLTYMEVVESADPLELGGTEFIAIAGVTAPSGIQQVLLLFGGTNHTMTDTGGGTWVYNNWIPSSLGTLSYKIYIQDNTGLWNWTSGAITAIDTTPPIYTSAGERYDPIQLGWYDPEAIGIQGVTDLSGIQTVVVEFEGSNHTMSNWSNDWYCDDIYPNHTGIFSYTIYIADNANNWIAVSGLFHVLNLATPCNSDPIQDEWPMFRGQLNHTGEAHTSLINPTIPFTNYQTGGPVFSSPAVAEGWLYVGSEDKNVYCLNATTGGFLWNYTTGDAIDSSPAIVGGRVYVGSFDHKVYCLNATTGKHLWNYTTGGGVSSSPAVADGRVYVGSDDRKVYCLNATTGSLLWSYTAGGIAIVSSSPAIAGGCVYVGAGYNIYCLNATIGEILWSYTTGYPVLSSPAVVTIWGARLLFIGAGYQLICLNAITGEISWIYNTGGFISSSPAVVGSRLYVGSEDGMIHCVDLVNGGESLWTYKTGGEVYSSPAVVGGRVYVGSFDNKIYCLDAITGGLLWSYTTGGDIYSSPAVIGGRVYVGNYDGKIYGPALPNYQSVNESVDPLEFGDMETIIIAGVESISGIQTVRLEIEGSNHTMANPGDGTSYYTTWTPSSAGNLPYKIYIQNNLGFWNTTIGAIQVVDTTPPSYSSVIESADPLELGGTEAITVLDVSANSGIQTVLLALEGTNHTMTITGSGDWQYTLWTPSLVGNYSYTIYIQDNLGNCKAISGAIQVVNTTLPTYTSVTESADSLELGGVETIILSGVADLSGIQTVLIAFEGGNHTMINLGGGTWCYNTWTPSSAGVHPYTIYIQDNLGNWKAITGSIQVNQTTAPPSFDPLIWILAAALIATIVLTILLYMSLNKKIRNLSQPKSITPQDPKLTGSSEPTKGPPKLPDEPKKPKSTTPQDPKLTGASEPKKKQPKPTDESKKSESKTAPVSNK